MPKCKVKVEDTVPHPDIPNIKQNVWVEKDAVFHLFGTAYEYAGEGGDKIAVTVAVVEMSDGQVVTIEPYRMRFTEPA